MVLRPLDVIEHGDFAGLSLLLRLHRHLARCDISPPAAEIASATHATFASVLWTLLYHTGSDDAPARSSLHSALGSDMIVAEKRTVHLSVVGPAMQHNYHHPFEFRTGDHKSDFLVRFQKPGTSISESGVKLFPYRAISLSIMYNST